jgi:hypothetical protein
VEDAGSSVKMKRPLLSVIWRERFISWPGAPPPVSATMAPSTGAPVEASVTTPLMAAVPTAGAGTSGAASIGGSSSTAPRPPRPASCVVVLVAGGGGDAGGSCRADRPTTIPRALTVTRMRTIRAYATPSSENCKIRNLQLGTQN